MDREQAFQLLGDTFSEVRIFLRGHDYDKALVARNLKTLLKFFTTHHPNLPQGVVGSSLRNKRLCPSCQKTLISAPRWRKGLRRCHVCRVSHRLLKAL